MPVSVTMPRLGESVTEGTVTRWLKQEGERVEADEPLLEVSTDKVDTEIPSPAAGVLTRIVVHEDETAEVGSELAVIGDEGESAPGPSEAASSAEVADDAVDAREAQEQEGGEKDAERGDEPGATEEAKRDDQPQAAEEAEPEAEQPTPEQVKAAVQTESTAEGTAVKMP